MADSRLMVEDAELDSGFCMEADSELSLAGGARVGSDGRPDREELDWFVITEHGRSVFPCDERPGDPRGDGRGPSRDEGEMEAGSASVEKGEKETEQGVDVDGQSEEEEMEGALDVCLRPVEESGGHVRISLEEVQRYYRFSRCCHWLFGRCQMLYHGLPSVLFLC